MNSDQLKRTVASFFGLPSLTCAKRQVKDDEGKVIDFFEIISYWIAQQHYINRQHALTVAVIKALEWQKGLILIPPLQEPLNREWGGPEPLKPVDITNWQDPVEEALHSVDLMPLLGPLSLGDAPSYSLWAGTRDTWSELHIENHIPGDEDEGSLWNALGSAIGHIVNIYDNDEFRNY